MLRGTGRRPGRKTTRTATLALTLLGLVGAGSAVASTSGGAGLAAPVPSAKAPAVAPLVPTLTALSGIPQLSAGLAVRKVSRRAASEAAIGYASRASAPLRVRIDVVRHSDGLSIFDVVRTVQPGTQRTYLWSGRAQHGVVAGDGGYEIRVSLGDGPTARPISAAGSSGSLDGAATPAGGASPNLTSAGPAPAPAVGAPQGSPPPPGAATVGAFSFVGAIFPVRGRHDYGDEANSFGAGRAGHMHEGQDVLAKCGTPLVAAVGGVVRTRARQANAGNYVVIDDPITKQSYVYAHLRQPAFVRHGMHVTAGEPIGIVGQTGDATTCHLHFELWTAPGWYSGGEPIDPLATLKHWDHAR